MGELIVVVSNEPLIVTGQVTRGFNHRTPLDAQPGDGVTFVRLPTGTSRTLDVRQYNCGDPDDFAKVAQFCRLSSVRTP